MSYGRYSTVAINAFERTVSDYRYHHGDIAGRTRSQARRRNAPRNAQDAVRHRVTPSAGEFTRTQRITNTLRARAEYRLRRSRLRLRRYLISDRWQADDEARTPWPEQIEQLGILSSSGEIQSIPRPQSGTWDSDLRMISRQARKKARPRSLREVERNWSEEELDEEYSVLPGEIWRDEADLDAEVDVMNGLTEDGRIEEALWEGVRAEGVWRMIKEGTGGDEVGAVTKWAIMDVRARERRVMAPRCVDVVRKVLMLKDV